MRRPKPKRVHAFVRVRVSSSNSDTNTDTLARLRGRTSDDVLCLARHLGYERRAESVEVWTWRQKKRRVGAKVGKGETCERWMYSRWFAYQRGEKLLLRERVRVSRREVPKMAGRKEAMETRRAAGHDPAEALKKARAVRGKRKKLG